MEALVKFLLLWLKAKRELIWEIRRQAAVLERKDEEIESLTRQRDTVLEMLDREKWRARHEVAARMSEVDQLGRLKTNSFP